MLIFNGDLKPFAHLLRQMFLQHCKYWLLERHSSYCCKVNKKDISCIYLIHLDSVISNQCRKWSFYQRSSPSPSSASLSKWRMAIDMTRFLKSESIFQFRGWQWWDTGIIWAHQASGHIFYSSKKHPEGTPPTLRQTGPRVHRNLLEVQRSRDSARGMHAIL